MSLTSIGYGSLDGKGLGKEKPLYYYEKAAEKGYPESFDLLFDELLFRAGASADVVKAKK